MKQLSEVEKAYLAGLVDGEGHIGLALGKKTKSYHNETYMPNITITNTNLSLLTWIKETTSLGFIFLDSNSRNIKWKTKGCWKLRTNEQIVFLRSILPYLVIKKLQAELLIEFHSLLEERVLSEEKIILRKVIYEELMELNKRGI